MIDTNILLDWLLDRDPYRTALVDRLFAKSKVLHVPDLVLVELVFALEKYYGLPREVVQQNVTKVLDEPLFNCNRAMFNQALIEYLEYPALSIIDCCLLRYADLQNALPLWTFDKKLVNQSSGKARLLN